MRRTEAGERNGRSRRFRSGSLERAGYDVDTLLATALPHPPSSSSLAASLAASGPGSGTGQSTSMPVLSGLVASMQSAASTVVGAATDKYWASKYPSSSWLGGDVGKGIGLASSPVLFDDEVSRERRRGALGYFLRFLWIVGGGESNCWLRRFVGLTGPAPHTHTDTHTHTTTNRTAARRHYEAGVWRSGASGWTKYHSDARRAPPDHHAEGAAGHAQ